MDPVKCVVSAYPQVDVSITSKIAFQREGVPIMPGYVGNLRFLTTCVRVCVCVRRCCVCVVRMYSKMPRNWCFLLLCVLYASRKFLGVKSEQYSFGGCWPCNHVDCAAGYGVDDSLACVMRKTGSRMSVDDESNCDACPPGKFKGSSGSEICSMCDSGFYNSLFAATECAQCPNASNSLGGSKYVSDCMCDAGYTGRFEVDPDLISLVERHFVAIGLGNASDGIVNDSKTLRGINYPNVTYIETFAPGPISWTGQCRACVPGKYKHANGSSDCLDCPEGKYSNASGATHVATCKDCTEHSHSLNGTGDVTGCLCVAGFTGADGEPCLPCDKGKYKSFNGSAVCSQCAAGKYVDFLGAISCLPCPPGVCVVKVNTLLCKLAGQV